MKKNLITTLGCFYIVTTLCFFSNFIRWDETPLEQSLWVLPLGIGLLLQIPLFSATFFLLPADHTVRYSTIWTIIPLLTGSLYSLLLYAILQIRRKTLLIGCSHLSAFLAGMIAVAIYHHWWINPAQVIWIQKLAGQNVDIGYPGDWVLDILFPALPLFALSVILTIVFTVAHLESTQTK